jgi:capsular polysaccharide biosynthesis protein
MLVMIPLGMVAGLALSRVHLHLSPRVYESEVIFQIKRSSAGISEVETEDQRFMKAQYHMSAEFELIKSRTILSKVSEKLALKKSWGADENTVVARLNVAVQVTKIRDTDLKRVKVTSNDPVEARDIAQELVTVYREWRTELVKESLDAQIKQLKRAVQNQEDEVEEARKELESILKIKSEGKPIDDSDVVEARRSFDQKSDVCDAMKLKLVSAKISYSLRETDIVIHDAPVIATAPLGLSDRSLKLNWMAGGVLFSPLLALPVMALLNRRWRPEMG